MYGDSKKDAEILQLSRQLAEKASESQVGVRVAVGWSLKQKAEITAETKSRRRVSTLCSVQFAHEATRLCIVQTMKVSAELLKQQVAALYTDIEVQRV